MKLAVAVTGNKLQKSEVTASNTMVAKQLVGACSEVVGGVGVLEQLAKVPIWHVAKQVLNTRRLLAHTLGDSEVLQLQVGIAISLH